MNRFLALAYGSVSYLIFFGTFLYAIGFVAGAPLPTTLDGGAGGPALGRAVAIDALLLMLFAIQHSVMARPGFKCFLTRFVPETIERSTYVLASSLAMIALFAFWQPMPQVVWQVSDPILRAALWILFAGGVAMILLSTALIDHFELFGLRQVVSHFRGKRAVSKRFVTPLFYKHIRHPLYVGWFTFFWATPDMSVGHLLLAIGTTAYTLVAIVFEERDLADALGREYVRWRAETPAFLPRLRRADPARPTVRA